MKELYSSPDPTYTSLNLSIFAISEVFVGAFTASLPPLRKTFEDLLRKIIPETLFGTSSRGKSENSYAMNGMGSQQSSKASKPRHDPDNVSDISSSEQEILQDSGSIDRKESDNGIVCTTEVSMSVDEKSLAESRGHSWV
jgi:hypothetical protein